MDEKGSKNVVLMAFGLPVMTTAIVLGSMYAGHLITTKSDRPTNVNVSAATPKIDVNVPQAAPPTVAVNATAPMVDVHVPQMPAPSVTVNPPSMPAPHITVNPPPASVTVIKEEKIDRGERLADRMDRPMVQTVAAAAPAVTVPLSQDVKPAVATPPSATVAPAKAPEVKPAEPAKTESNKSSSVNTPAAPSAPAVASAPKDLEDPTVDTLYAYAGKYIDTYCKKRGLDPNAEAKKWNNAWKSAVEQSINDNIDSGEQSFINRQVIAKRDHFNLESATPEKVVEACRILLRYRDAQLAWLQAMQDAMTKENLRKTVAFLAAGPR